MRLVIVDDHGKVHTVIPNLDDYDLKRPIAQAAICNKIFDEKMEIAVKEFREDNR